MDIKKAFWVIAQGLKNAAVLFMSSMELLFQKKEKML